MPPLRPRVFAILLLLIAFSAGAWKFASSTAQPAAPAPVAQVRVAQSETEKAPGLAAPAQPVPPTATASIARPASASSNSVARAPAAQPTAARTQPYRVAIQIGHYKNNELPAELSRLSENTGTYGGGRSEVDLNYDIANRVAALLRAQGIVVDVLPATVPTGYTADAFIAIHADGNASSAPRGFKISTRWRSPIAWQDARLVETLIDSYGAATGLPEDSNVTRNMRGYYAYASWRPNYRISNFTPGAIVEMGYMTNAADRAVMFNEPTKVASGIASGIVNFLKEAYGSPRVSRTYGAGVSDPSINVHAPWQPTPAPGSASGPPPQSRAQSGNWLVLFMGKPTIKVYSQPGGGQVVAQLPRDHFYKATVRKGDYYQINLPNGGTGWVNRNLIVVQM
jgi:N-acetylmuramoyl-L-alanine amidase